MCSAYNKKITINYLTQQETQNQVHVFSGVSTLTRLVYPDLSGVRVSS